MNRRDFIKVAGALGFCLVTPRIGRSSVIDGQSGEIIEPDMETVRLTVNGLLPGTHIWVGTVDDQGIGHDTLWQGRAIKDKVRVRVPKHYDGQQVFMRTIHEDAIYNQMQFVCDKDTEIDVITVPDRLYRREGRRIPYLQYSERNYEA